MLGAIAASVVLLVSHLSGIAAQVGWVPFIFLAIVAFGFTTWEAGFIGMQAPNSHFRRFGGAQGRQTRALREASPDGEKRLKKVSRTPR